MSSTPSDPTIDLKPPADASNAETLPPDSSSAALVAILDQYMADLEAGKSPDRARLIAEHPALAEQLEACLAGIAFVHRATVPESRDDQPAQLGEFQIIREIGRGGMGVVYEAEQISLRRRVALKVLRFGVVADPEAMRRFEREAQTVARLHHTNIVPIFAVGCERGVHYYAMQFIGGRSLADVQADAQREGRLLAIDDVVRWGLQAAEALAHAHQREVIHRDIKPSNLLLDNEGIVWLTDFGLAKRADEASMTVSGALMGTPRYMSPEQAEAMQRPVDHRTDLYSLGATLYELATGRPLFNAPTIHGLLAQILSEEPSRPRTLRPEISRDFETVILTCLSKDPAQRYNSAQTLAGDLRAVLDGRAIQARRAPWTERLARSVRKHRKAVRVASIAVAASLLVVAAILGGWSWFREWRLGRVLLSTEGLPLTAQVVQGDGETAVAEPFSIGTNTSLALPAGDYQLRLKAAGRLGRTVRLGLNRGETLTRTVSLEEGVLFGADSIPFARTTEAVAFGPSTKSDFVEWTGQTVVRRDGASGKLVWDLTQPAKPWPADRDSLAWMRRLFNRANEQQPGRIVPIDDLNGDGIRDLVLAFWGTPSLLALSGQDGSFLWAVTMTPEGARAPGPEPAMGWIIGSPIVTDVDGDKTPDLITGALLASEHHAVNGLLVGGKGRRVVAAVSGKDGHGLWIQPIDAESRALELDEDRASSVLLRGPGGAVVGVLGSLPASATESASWLLFDRGSGKPVGAPIDLSFAPVRPVQVADLDGDGIDELLALGPGATTSGLFQNQLLAALSLASGRPLWTVTVRGAYTRAQETPAPQWPLAVDIDGDGRSEVAVPDWGAFSPDRAYRGVAVLEGTSGKVRWSHPLRPWTADSLDLQHLTAGPDLDGDGIRDLVALSRFQGRRPFASFPGRTAEPSRVYVDVLSGQSGRQLWWWNHDVDKYAAAPGPPEWWTVGPEGVIALVVSVNAERPQWLVRAVGLTTLERPESYVLSPATGRSVSSVIGLSAPRFGDLDGDGVPDLWGAAEGRLKGFRGEPPEAWRALGRWTPAGDLDRDGVDDVLTGDLVPAASRIFDADDAPESRTMAARSGRNGRELWRTVLDRGESLSRPYRSYHFATFPSGADFNGDGTPDLLVRMGLASSNPQDRLPFELRSGRTGQKLWAAPGFPRSTVQIPAGYQPLARSVGSGELLAEVAHDIDRKGQPDLVIVRLVLVALQPTTGPLAPGSAVPSAVECRLARIDGRDGHLIWDVPLADAALSYSFSRQFAHEIGDLDGDGSPGIVVPVHAGLGPGQVAAIGSPGRYRLVAVSLRDGKRLWSRPLRRVGIPATFRVGDLDADGRDEVVVADSPEPGTKETLEIVALNGHDGNPRWTWLGGNESDASRGPSFPFRLAAFEKDRGRTVCVNIGTPNNERRLVLLDANGHEHASRALGPRWWITLETCDLDGDGRDELLYHYDGKLRAVRGNLAEIWSWPYEGLVREVLPGRDGRPGTVVLNPNIGLDGATGRPRWSGPPGNSVVLDRTATDLPPRLLAIGSNETSCHVAFSADPAGRLVLPAVMVTPASRNAVDPRWKRPLPWTPGGSYNVHPLQFVIAAGAALIVLVVPVGIVRFARRERRWGLPLLMALPIALAIPLTVFVVTRSYLSAEPAPISPLLTVFGITAFAIAGFPVLVYAQNLVRGVLLRRWKGAAVLVGLTLAASALVGVYMLRYDLHLMPAIEFFDWSEWYDILPLGVYTVGLLLLVAKTLGGIRAGLRHVLSKPATTV